MTAPIRAEAVPAGPPRLEADRGGAIAEGSLLVHLLCEVMCLAERLEETDLGLQPIGVLFLRVKNALEELARPVVAERAAQLDRLVQHRDRLVLEREIERELLRHRLTDVDL